MALNPPSLSPLSRGPLECSSFHRTVVDFYCGERERDRVGGSRRGWNEIEREEGGEVRGKGGKTGGRERGRRKRGEGGGGHRQRECVC